MIQLLQAHVVVNVFSLVLLADGAIMRRGGGGDNPAQLKPAVVPHGPRTLPPPKDDREVAARLIGELERMLGPNQHPQVRVPTARPIAFSAEAMRHAEDEEDREEEDREEEGTTDVAPECVALRKTNAWLQILQTELNTSWPGWLHQFNLMREELKEAHEVYAPVVTALEEAQQTIVNCINDGGAGCKHPALRALGANVVTPNGSNETAAQQPKAAQFHWGPCTKRFECKDVTGECYRCGPTNQGS
jgi:hypothetical protein